MQFIMLIHMTVTHTTVTNEQNHSLLIFLVWGIWQYPQVLRRLNGILGAKIQIHCFLVIFSVLKWFSVHFMNHVLNGVTTK